MKSNENGRLVSAIIPTRDRPDMLIRAVRSVARQSYRDIEIIIVDDGCMYDVEARVRKEDDLRSCRVIRNTRTPGAPGARNTGFYQSQGAFLGFLDDDDEWMPNKIEKQIAAFQNSKSQVGIVCTEDIVVTGTEKYIRQIKLEGDVFTSLCREHAAGNTSNPLIKRHVFEEAGLFDEDMISGQDTDLWLRIAKRYHFTTVNEPLALIYRHGSERITKNRQKQILGMYRLLRKHWTDLHLQRKYRLTKRIIRLSIALAQQKLRSARH